MRRRIFIKNTASGLAMASLPFSAFNFKEEFPVQQITDGDKQHWFGYYDKWQVDPSGRYALGNQVDLFYRSPKPDDVLRIGLIDLENNFKWQEIGKSSAWGWQQGCMLQWIPGSQEEVIWNDRQGDLLVKFLISKAEKPALYHGLSIHSALMVVLDSLSILPAYRKCDPVMVM